MRKASTSPEEVPIPSDIILSAKSPHLELQSDGIVFVPNSTAKTVATRSLEAMVQTATGLQSTAVISIDEF